jgi:methylase of polypeptide subunit release factors
VDFGGLEIAFDDEVLAPRPWTESQAAWAVELLPSLPRGAVLELCCGAGQIGLVVASRSGRRLVQVDDDVRACTFAARNAEAAGIEADVRCASLEDALRAGERFSLVLADPPYIRSAETNGFGADPDHAIDGGPDGLAIARRCIAVARRALVPGGAVLLQARGVDQARSLTVSSGFSTTEVRTYGRDRAVLFLADPDAENRRTAGLV